MGNRGGRRPGGTLRARGDGHTLVADQPAGELCVMPIDYKIDTTQRRVVATAYGTLTDADVFDYQRAVWSRADVAGFDEIVDMRAVKIVELPRPVGGRLAA